MQTDTGTEFAAPWNSLKKTLFPNVIELSFCSTHKTMPVGSKTYQNGGERSHRLIEDAFYVCRYFSSAQDFLKKTHQYETYFNFKLVLFDIFLNLYNDEFRLLAF